MLQGLSVTALFHVRAGTKHDRLGRSRSQKMLSIPLVGELERANQVVRLARFLYNCWRAGASRIYYTIFLYTYIGQRSDQSESSKSHCRYAHEPKSRETPTRHLHPLPFAVVCRGEPWRQPRAAIPELSSIYMQFEGGSIWLQTSPKRERDTSVPALCSVHA